MRFYQTSEQLPYKTGSQYQGGWKDNKKHGYGIKSWISGNKYEGEWEADQRHGKGTFWVTQDGKPRKQYAGEWKCDKREGTGTFNYADGGRYKGGWQANRRNGHGVMSYRDGEVYSGGWLDDKRSGEGSLWLPNGDVFEGHWLLGKKEGPGRFLHTSTRKIYQGEWVADTPKCGELRDMPSNLRQRRTGTRGTLRQDLVDPTVPDESFALPVLTLKWPGRVLGEVTAVVRNSRAVVHRQPGRVFAEDEMEALREAFTAFDTSGEGLVPASSMADILRLVNISVEAGQVQEVLDELQAEPDTASLSLSLPEFTEIVALLLTT